MKNTSQQNSCLFNIEGQKSRNNQKIQQRLDNLFNQNTNILHPNQKKMVVFGAMEQQKKTIYQTLQPYLWTAAEKTTKAASFAGRQIFQAISNGASWIYDKLINKVIPYTREQIPKWFFITKKQPQQQKKSQNNQSSTYYHLQIQQNIYQKIKQKTSKKKSKIIIPLDNTNDPQFIQFLKNQNFIPNNSFPIDIDTDQDSQTMIIPSGNFKARYNQTLNKIYDHNSKILSKSNTKSSQNISIQNSIQNQQPIQSIIDQYPKQNLYNEVENYKKVQKKILKLKDCYIFQLEGKNSIEYDLLDGIGKDPDAYTGYLIKSEKFNIPMISTEVSVPPSPVQNKNVSNIKVKVQIPNSNQNQKSQEIAYPQFA